MHPSILLGQRANIKPASRPHDPHVCGLGFDSDCDACQAARLRAERDFLERDAEARERGRLRAIAERFAETTGIPLADLAAALVPHLTQPMAEMACAVFEEREATS